MLQASAAAGTISMTLTLGSGVFPVVTGTPSHDQLTVAGAPVSTGPFFGTSSLYPPRISDPATGFTGQAGATMTASVNSQTLAVSTASFGTASSAFDGGAGGSVINSPLSFAPFSQPTPATLNVNLMSDYGVNPNASFSVQTSELGTVPGDHTASAEIVTGLDAGGLSPIFSIDVLETWQNGSTSFSVNFTSPYISAPISASDFIAGPNGEYSLDPNKRQFSVPFTIPAGVIIGFQTGSGVVAQVIPEPATIVLFGIALVTLAVPAVVRKSPRRKTKN